ncbi:hypothetical protein [Shewanella surugensis]|uniref:Uncharacterized protein n=1 Tax=Shewanella surugensis TaxID=212020 RepID=A0ABT0LCT2_9GAMM|nr:hypothetical protein [Shewanella surugensis]MCL1125516.1 hypothetical protein [Shewanella surugensis]
MNFRDPELVLVKHFRGEMKSFFQVSGLNGQELILRDVESGGRFSFLKKDIETFLRNGKLKAMSVNELPSCILDNPLSRRKAIPKTSGDDLGSKQMERRYQYVKGVIDIGLPAYTEKWLSPYIKNRAVEIGDDHPPGWRSLAGWMKLYIESGWEKKSLLPRHKLSGNRQPKLHLEVGALLDSIVLEYTYKHVNIRYMKAYHDFLERLEALNKKRETDGLIGLQPCSYNALRRRFKA